MPYICGKCGAELEGRKEIVDEHDGTHLYMPPGMFAPFIVVNNGRPYLGANTGFDPLRNAKYAPIDLFDPFVEDPESTEGSPPKGSHLWNELVQVVEEQKRKLEDGFFKLPDELSRFPAIAQTLRSFTLMCFPEQSEDFS